MNATKTILIMTLAGIWLAGCNSSGDQSSGENLQLDNGQKWIANAATQASFENIQTRLNLFAKESAALTDYSALGDELQKEIDNMVEQCTMKGQGHEELHKLLIPMIVNIKDLKKDELEICKKAFSELEKLTEKYFEYFKI